MPEFRIPAVNSAAGSWGAGPSHSCQLILQFSHVLGTARQTESLSLEDKPWICHGKLNFFLYVLLVLLTHVFPQISASATLRREITSQGGGYGRPNGGDSFRTIQLLIDFLNVP